MATEWTDPELGRFVFEQFDWKTTLRVPAFDGFAYGMYGGHGPGSSTLCFSKPMFGPRANANPPSAHAIGLARRLFTHQEQLASAISSALWDEFHGRGPTSGMWWRGKFEEIRRAVVPTVDTPEDLRRLLGSPGILIHDDPESLPQVTFKAAFEEEHGIAILTDGLQVLGTGYMSDGARPYTD